MAFTRDCRLRLELYCPEIEPRFFENRPECFKKEEKDDSVQDQPAPGKG